MDRSVGAKADGQSAPDYRRPVAPGQSYPPLGYSDRGAPLFTYDDRERALAGPQPVVVAPEPEPQPPMVEPQPPDRRRNLAIGVGVIAVAILCLALAFQTFGRGNANDSVTRADPPATQSTDDPYLQGIPDGPESTVPRDPSAAPSTVPGDASVVYEVESGRATVLYVDGADVKIASSRGGVWKQSVGRGTNALFRITVVPSDAEPVKCTITIDGKVVDQQSSANQQTSGMVTCRFEG
ncbi:hypothetical protein [Gordonia sp. (in: high G+C Gram-positive bacteria)]|uniref:hypothetical protein n=1 Tax=Gordonia sp. (in: high G+C Gram-positive bacteria) TaxID=84139 RepID=UPI003C749D25